MAIGRVNTGGGGSGGTLTVTGVAGDTVTAAKSGKTYSRTFNSSGIATFKGLATGTWALTMTDGSQSVTQNVTINADYTLTMAYFSALITTTWPEGSTCSCTDGTSTLYAPDTSGSYTFNVPNKGTWTVTATNGDKTASKSVSITAEGQTKSVALAYEYVLYDAGTKYVDFQDYNYSGSISWGSDSVTITGDTTGFGTTSTVDVTDYSTLNISAIYTGSGSGYEVAHFGLRSSLSIAGYPYDIADLSLKNSTAKSTQSLDVSSISGSYYVCLCKHLSSLTAYKIWLE